jgi:hypothetical protein
MKIIRADARTVSRRWKSLYFSAIDGWRKCQGGSAEIYKALVDLGETATIEQIDDVVGNPSWTHFICQECCEYVLEVIELGDDASIFCRPCIEKASKL